MMLLDKIKSYRVVLASQSPRRRELLNGLGVSFEVMQSHEPEVVDGGWKPQEAVCHLSLQKAAHVFAQLSVPQVPLSSPEPSVHAVPSVYPTLSTPPLLVIGGDTIVVSEDRILGKPHDREEAFAMLQQLSGKTHHVYSGLCVMTSRQQLCDCDVTEVTFEPLGKDDMDYYIDRFHPFDKAGSYGVQEWIGYRGIRALNGSFYTVVGLPTHLLWKMLEAVV